MNRRIPVHTHALALACAVIVAALAFTLPSEKTAASLSHDVIKRIPLPLPDLSGSDAAQENDPDVWRAVRVRRGEGLYHIFSRLGLQAADLQILIASGPRVEALTRVHPGQRLAIRADAAGRLLELRLETDAASGLRAVREGDVFRVSEYSHEIEQRRRFASSLITHSLYASARAAGLSDRLVMQLAEIFAWDIDFALDIHPGDRFTVLYQEDYVQGRRIGNGQILAAEFTNRGTTYRAVRYVHPDGAVHYYTPEGRAMRRAFLRSPVDFRRISSHFQANRWHPILGVKRPHRGADYAAAVGTPVRAAGDGRVIFLGPKGGYGNTIILQHGRRYSTLYAHLARFEPGLHPGSRVEQGAIIGYVGTTGLASGPHLHYEFRVDGVHHDPVTVELPKSLPIAELHRADFRRTTAPLGAQLDVYKRAVLARNP